MTNAHASKQHGVTTHNTTRPKSKLRKRLNKHRSVSRKMEIIMQRRAAKKGSVATPAKAAPVAPKTVVKKPAEKKPATKKTIKKVAEKTE